MLVGMFRCSYSENQTSHYRDGKKGETGTGKTSFLSLLFNVLAGRSPNDYNLEPYDVTNESGGAQKHSQTKGAKVYKFASLNGVDVTVLDTPGLADTRGLQKDEEHKQSITTAIRENIPEVTAVIILANGTNPRLGVATDYAITTLCSIFPRTLAQNIGILFSNVSSPLSWNFEVETLPVELRGAKRFLIDNPFAMQKNYLKIHAKADAEGEIDENDQDILDDRATVNAGHQAALKTLVKIFDWLDGLEPQATEEITSLYNQSIEIERNISSTLARMTQLSEKSANLDQLIKQSDGIKLVSRIIRPYSSALTIQNVCRLLMRQQILRASSTRRLGCSKTNLGTVLSAAIHNATPTAISIVSSDSSLNPQY